MRTLVKAAALGLVLLARPDFALAQDVVGDGKNVLALSMGYNPAPVGGLAVTGLYGRDVSFLRAVVAVDAIGTGGSGDYYFDTELTGVCREIDGGQVTDSSNCFEDMDFAGRGELLARLPFGLSAGPGVRYRRDFTPYAAAQLEVKVGPASSYLLFAHGAVGEDFQQFDLGFGLRL